MNICEYIKTKRVLSNDQLENYINRKRNKRFRNQHEDPETQKAKRWVHSSKGPHNPCDPGDMPTTRPLKAAAKRTAREEDRAKRLKANMGTATKPTVHYYCTYDPGKPNPADAPFEMPTPKASDV